MRLRQQRNLIQALAFLLPVMGVGAVAMAVLLPFQVVSLEKPKRKYIVKEIAEFPSDDQLELALKKRLQGPLNPRVVTPVQVVQPKPRITWPSYKLDCILFGQESRIAVLTSRNKIFRCSEGDLFLGVRVEKIKPDEVTVSFRGESKKLRPSESRANQ